MGFGNENALEVGDALTFYTESFGGSNSDGDDALAQSRNVGAGVLFLAPILRSEFSALQCLELAKCNLCDADLSFLVRAWRQRQTQSALQMLSLAENPRLSDAFMDELFDALSAFLGNVQCLMLHET